MRAAEAGRGGLYDAYVVALLTAAYMLSFLDRNLLALLLPAIRREFRLDGTQAGLLLGFGFAAIYAAMGLAFGALADCTSRARLVVLGVAGWSLATAAGGLARGFPQLFAARALVGVGEASLAPSAYSTLADRFPSERLGRAVAVFASGVTMGAGAALVFGGALAEWAEHARWALPVVGEVGGWRLALGVTGLLGLPLAVLIALTLREAPRRGVVGAPASWRAVGWLAAARRGRVARILVAFGLANVVNYALALWTPAFLISSLHMTTSQVGLVLGVDVGVLGTFGTIMGGVLCDRVARRGVEEAAVRVVRWATVAQAGVVPIAVLAPFAWARLAGVAVLTVLATTASGVQGLAVQQMAPADMRGRLTSLYLVLVTLIGMGLGPLAVGWSSDKLFHGPRALAFALAASCTFAALASALLSLSFGERKYLDPLSTKAK